MDLLININTRTGLSDWLKPLLFGGKVTMIAEFIIDEFSVPHPAANPLE